MQSKAGFKSLLFYQPPSILCSDSNSDVTHLLGYASGQCDCACGASFHLPSHSRTIVPWAELRAHPELERLVLNEEYKVVFVPSKSALVVINSVAEALVDIFAEPHSMDFARSLGCDKEVSTLVEAGILTGGMAGSIPYQPNEELVVWLHVTNDCNLSCSYCYLNKTSEMMSFEVGSAAIDAICRSANLHGYRRAKLKFAGGEPTLVMPLVLQLSDYAKTKMAQQGLELQSVILSNGAHLTEGMIEDLLCRNIHLMISLDGLGSGHDEQRSFVNGSPSCSSVIKSINLAVSMGLVPEISITITPYNAFSLGPLLEWILEQDTPFNLHLYRENDNSKCHTDLRLKEETVISGMLEAYATIKKRFPSRPLLGCLLDYVHMNAPHQYTCGAGYSYLVIDHHGRIAKCQMEIDKTVTSVWEYDPLLALHQSQSGLSNLAVEKRVECCRCKWRYWCAGGCPLETYRSAGKYDSKSPNCNAYRRLLPEVIKLEGERLLHSCLRK